MKALTIPALATAPDLRGEKRGTCFGRQVHEGAKSLRQYVEVSNKWSLSSYNQLIWNTIYHAILPAWLHRPIRPFYDEQCRLLLLIFFYDIILLNSLKFDKFFRILNVIFVFFYHFLRLSLGFYVTLHFNLKSTTLQGKHDY